MHDVPKVQSFLLRVYPQPFQDIAQALTEREIDLLQTQLPRFNFREVEDVIQDPQQCFGGTLHGGRVLALLSSEGSLQQ